MRAIGRSEVDDESQLGGSVMDVLLLEGAFLRLVRPRQTLVEIETEVKRGSESDDTPSNGAPNDAGNGEETWRAREVNG